MMVGGGKNAGGAGADPLESGPVKGVCGITGTTP